MTSINPHYTFNYSQPEEYRLSHDSIFLARQIYEQLTHLDLTQSTVLDVCSGSGVVGMDFLFHRRANNQSLPQIFDFLEIQEIYKEHFNQNKQSLGELPTKLHFVHRNYNDLQLDIFREKYDLIMSAPPYFRLGKGKLSPSEFKNRCRFFIDSDLKNLLLGIAFSLKKSGVAYILLRDLPEHGLDVIHEAKKICQDILRIEIIGDIRGTHFLKLRASF
ncbi:MAG: methyltransferase [Bdellovibrionota bacterium]